MADDSDDYKANQLELLRSGNFSDVDIVCGDRTWKCHRAILASHSVWFRKALSGPFVETSTRRVNLGDENPVCIDLALQYIYGSGLDVKSAVDDEHFMEHCVALWHTADFLLLHSLKFSVDEAVRTYCDKRLKQLHTFGSDQTRWLQDDEKRLSPWALDVLLGLQEAYQCGCWKCVRCHKTISWATPESRAGQIADPFTLIGGYGLKRGWCRDCGKLDMIPWRD